MIHSKLKLHKLIKSLSLIIKSLRFEVIFRKLVSGIAFFKKVLIYTVNMVWALPCSILIVLIHPFLEIRLGSIWSGRIGHFIEDPAIYLTMINSQKKNSKKSIWLFYLNGEIANTHWVKMVSKQLFISPWVRYLFFFCSLLPLKKKICLELPSATGPGRDMILQKTEVKFSFSNDEEAFVKKWLRKYGWKDGEPFVCIHVRDSAYLEQNKVRGDDYSYHTYRDSEIETYMESIIFLINKGYWVFRMGKAANQSIPYKHLKLIDCPFLSDSNDMIDVWLSLNCHFYVSTSSGPVLWPAISKRPILFVNALPLIDGFYWTNRIWVPKHLIWRKSGKKLTLKEYFQYPLVRSDDYIRSGINVKSLSSSEILLAVKECEQRVSGTLIYDEIDINYQKTYWNTLSKIDQFNHSYSIAEINPMARAGKDWLRSLGYDFYN